MKMPTKMTYRDKVKKTTAPVPTKKYSDAGKRAMEDSGRTQKSAPAKKTRKDTASKRPVPASKRASPADKKTARVEARLASKRARKIKAAARKKVRIDARAKKKAARVAKRGLIKR
jgi:hypothetical protein